MRQNDKRTRQAIGCGYELAVADARPWQPAGFPAPDLEVCPGYTTKLPEVVEVSWARHYLHKGSLGQWCQGQATEGLLRHVEVFEVACAEADAFEAAERERNAKGK